MAKTIKATIIDAKINDESKAILTLEFDDGVGKWQKTYIFNQTEPINFVAFKDQVTADLRKDLKTNSQLTNITAQIGKQFILTV